MKKIKIFRNEAAKVLEMEVATFIYRIGKVDAADCRVLDSHFVAFHNGNNEVFTMLLWLEVSEKFEREFESIP